MNLLESLFGKRAARNAPPEPQLSEMIATMEALMAAAKAHPPRPMLYMFQYEVIPKAVFRNSGELLNDLENPVPFLPPLFQLRCLTRGLWNMEQMHANPAGHDDRLPDTTDADFEADQKLFAGLTVQKHQRNGFTVHTVTMPEPEVPPEAYFVAIVYKDGELRELGRPSPSTRYFTLEKSRFAFPMLCEILADKSRRSFGPGTEAMLPAFVEAVFDRLAVGQPGSTRVLLAQEFADDMKFAKFNGTGVHLVTVSFADGTKLENAKVYRQNELELPPEFLGKAIQNIALNPGQS